LIDPGVSAETKQPASKLFVNTNSNDQTTTTSDDEYGTIADSKLFSNKPFVRIPNTKFNALYVTGCNLWRLLDRQCLNDELVDFIFRFLLKNYKLNGLDPRKKICVFPCHLFINLSKNLFKEADELHQHVNLFQMDFLVIPINEDDVHWSVIIVAYPCLIAGVMNNQYPEDEEADNKPCMIHLDSLDQNSTRCQNSTRIFEIIRK